MLMLEKEEKLNHPTSEIGKKNRLTPILKCTKYYINIKKLQRF